MIGSMASVDSYRPAPREAYQPPMAASNANGTSARAEHSSGSKSPRRRRDAPPPTPPIRDRNASSNSSPARSPSRRGRSTPDRLASKSPPTMRQQWIFTDEEVASSPSITIAGLSQKEESVRRAKGVNFIFQAGAILELPQTTLWVAGVFFHRFFMRHNMEQQYGGVHHYNIAATSLFLANKTEENCRKTKDIIITVARVAQKNPRLVMDEQVKDYWIWRDTIITHEERMLESLTFDLMVANPYTMLYKLLEKTKMIHNRPLRHAAWAFVNDSCMTVLPLLMGTRDIAIAGMFFASIYTGQKFEDMDGQEWWKAVGGSESNAEKAIRVVREFYMENPLRRGDNPYTGTPDFLLRATRRSSGGSSGDGTPKTDRATQSPKVITNDADATNGKEKDAEPASQEAGQEAAPATVSDDASRTVSGDSDAALKLAANDPATHMDTSPKSPKRAASDELDDRHSKRPRTADGEVNE